MGVMKKNGTREWSTWVMWSPPYFLFLLLQKWPKILNKGSNLSQFTTTCVQWWYFLLSPTVGLCNHLEIINTFSRSKNVILSISGCISNFPPLLLPFPDEIWPPMVKFRNASDLHLLLAPFFYIFSFISEQLQQWEGLCNHLEIIKTWIQKNVILSITLLLQCYPNFHRCRRFHISLHARGGRGVTKKLSW